MKSDSSNTRRYKQTARAEAATENGERILRAFNRQLQQGWFDEIRLEDVAQEAEVSVQTVIRRFGGKDGLLEACTEMMDREIRAERQMPVGDVDQIIELIIAEYELRGDQVMRLLAQEDRYPQIRKNADRGREVHREWTGDVFAPWLDRLSGSERRDVHDRLVIALDIYVWKLVRLDMKRSKASLARTMKRLCASALGLPPEDLTQAPALPKEESHA
jgi:AcrR family transcriptional regulator